MRKIQGNAAAVAALTVVFAALTLVLRPASVLGRVVEDFGLIPRHLPGWTGANVGASDVLPNSSVLMRDYTNVRGRTANLTVVYGLDIADIHKPEFCLQGVGWSQIDRATAVVRPPTGAPHEAAVLLVKDANGSDYICTYWYADRDGARQSLAEQRVAVWRRALFHHAVRPTALVRILVSAAGDAAAARRDALSLAAQVDGPVMRTIRREPKVLPARRTVGE